MPTPCRCWPPCVPVASRRHGCGCRARANPGARAISPNWRPWPRSWAWPMRCCSPHPPRPLPPRTRPATWCCSCRASPRPSAVPWWKRWRWAARCWAGPMAGWANCCRRCSRPARCRRSTAMRWPRPQPGCCASRPRRWPSPSPCRPCSRPPWTCMRNWPAEHAPAPGRAFAWTPAWVLLAVALWPLPGPAEAVLSLGALAVAVQLAWCALRRRPLPLQRGAFVLAGLLFGAYWLPELLSAADALDRARAWKETLADLRYLPLLWGVAIAVREPRGRGVVLGGLALLALAWSVDALLQALAGASPLFLALDALKALAGGGPLCPVAEVQAWDRVNGVFGDCNPK